MTAAAKKVSIAFVSLGLILAFIQWYFGYRGGDKNRGGGDKPISIGNDSLSITSERFPFFKQWLSTSNLEPIMGGDVISGVTLIYTDAQSSTSKTMHLTPPSGQALKIQIQYGTDDTVTVSAASDGTHLLISSDGGHEFVWHWLVPWKRYHEIDTDDFVKVTAYSPSQDCPRPPCNFPPVPKTTNISFDLKSK
jgi:hypothetical protein